MDIGLLIKKFFLKITVDFAKIFLKLYPLLAWTQDRILGFRQRAKAQAQGL